MIAARAGSAAERKPMPWSRALLAALLAAAFTLGGVSASYGTLHPLAASNATFPPSTTLRDGRSERLDFGLENHGPAAARILGVALADGRGLRLVRSQLGGERLVKIGGPRFVARTIQPGEDLPLFVQIGYPPCRRQGTSRRLTLRAFHVRLEVAGSRRTQRVLLDEPLDVSC